jgi:hypothetical protein
MCSSLGTRFRRSTCQAQISSLAASSQLSPFLGLCIPAHACEVVGQVNGEPTCLVTSDGADQPYVGGNQALTWVKHVQELRKEAARQAGLSAARETHLLRRTAALTRWHRQHWTDDCVVRNSRYFTPQKLFGFTRIRVELHPTKYHATRRVFDWRQDLKAILA